MTLDVGCRIAEVKWLAAVIVLLAIGASPAVSQETTRPPKNAAESGGVDDATQIRVELDDILADPEFRRVLLKVPKDEPRKVPKWLSDFFEWLANLLSGIGALFSALGIGLQALAWTVLALLVGLIIYLIVRVISNYQRSEAARKAAGLAFEHGELPAAPGELAADVYLQRALALAGEGRYREAIGLLLLGLMSHAERAGLIRHRRGLTHRDYLRAVRGQASLHQSFRQLVGVYEPICFGRREARSEHFELSLTDYHAGLKHG